VRAELESGRQKHKENRNKHEMSQGQLRELALNDRAAKEVPWHATIRTEGVKNNGRCVANDRGNLNSESVVPEKQEESDAPWHHDQEDWGEDKKALKRKGRRGKARVTR
jgi:hypothetical protein